MIAPSLGDRDRLSRFYREEVLPRLGVEDVFPNVRFRQRGREWRAPCPLHQGKNDSFSVNTDSLEWVCQSKCQDGGDPAKFLMLEESMSFRDAVLELARRVGVDTSELTGKPKPASAPRPKPVARPVVPPDDAPTYPPPADIAALWRACERVDSDEEASAYLLGRPHPIDPTAVADRDLARVLPRNLALPWNCGYRGISWHGTGHRIVVPVFDAAGFMRSVIARRLRPEEPKTLPYAGFAKRGLVMADGLGQQMLATGKRPEWWSDAMPFRVYIAEGETDFLAGVTGFSESDEFAPVVLGIYSGSETQDIADRIPDHSVVIIATDSDEAGQKYEAKLKDKLLTRCAAGRLEVKRWRPKT